MFGEAKRILLADINIEAAQGAAQRINDLIGEKIAEGRQLDVSDRESVPKLWRVPM